MFIFDKEGFARRYNSFRPKHIAEQLGIKPDTLAQRKKKIVGGELRMHEFMELCNALNLHPVQFFREDNNETNSDSTEME